MMDNTTNERIKIDVDVRNAIKNLKQFKNAFNDSIGTMEGTLDVMDSISKTAKQAVSGLNKLADAGGKNSEMFASMASAIENVHPALIAIGAVLTVTVKIVKKRIAEMKKEAEKNIQQLKKIVKGFGRFLKSTITSLIRFTMRSFKTLSNVILQSIKSVIKGASNLFKQLVRTITGILKGLVRSVAGVFKSLTKTITKLIKSLMKSVVSIVKSLARTVINLVKSLAKTVLKLIKSLTKSILKLVKSLAKSVLKVIKSLIKSIISLIKGLIKTVLGLVKSLASSILRVVKSLTRSILRAVRSMAKSVISVIKSLGKSIVNTFTSATKLAIRAVSGLGKGIISSLKGVLSSTKGIMGQISNVISETIDDEIADMELNIDANVDSKSKGGSSGSKLNAMSTLLNTGMLMSSMKTITSSIGAGSGNLASKAVGNMATKMLDAGNKAFQFGKFVYQAYRMFKQYWPSIMSSFESISEKVKPVLEEGFKSIVQSTKNILKDGMALAVDKVGELPDRIAPLLEIGFKKMMNGIQEFMNSGFVQAIKEASSIARQKVTELFQGLLAIMKPGFMRIINILGEYIQSIVSSMSDTLGNSLSEIVTIIGSLRDSFANIGTSISKSLKEEFIGLLGSLKDVLVKNLPDIIANIVVLIQTGIRKLLGQVLSILAPGLEKVLNAFKDLLVDGLDKILTLFNKFMNSDFVKSARGLITKVKDKLIDVVDVVHKIISSVKEIMDGGFKGVVNRVNKIFSEGVHRMIESNNPIIRSLGLTLEFLQNVLMAIKPVFTSLGEAVLKVVNKLREVLPKIDFKPIIRALSSAFEDVGNFLVGVLDGFDFSAIGKVLENAKYKIERAVINLARTLQRTMKHLGYDSGEDPVETIEDAGRVVGKALTVVVEKFIDRFTDMINKTETHIGVMKLFTEATQGSKGKLELFKDAVKIAVGELKERFPILGTIIEGVKKVFEPFKNSINVVLNWFDKLKEGLFDLFGVTQWIKEKEGKNVTSSDRQNIQKMQSNKLTEKNAAFTKQFGVSMAEIFSDPDVKKAFTNYFSSAKKGEYKGDPIDWAIGKAYNRAAIRKDPNAQEDIMGGTKLFSWTGERDGMHALYHKQKPLADQLISSITDVWNDVLDSDQHKKLKGNIRQNATVINEFYNSLLNEMVNLQKYGKSTLTFGGVSKEPNKGVSGATVNKPSGSYTAWQGDVEKPKGLFGIDFAETTDQTKQSLKALDEATSKLLSEFKELYGINLSDLFDDEVKDAYTAFLTNPLEYLDDMKQILSKKYGELVGKGTARPIDTVDLNSESFTKMMSFLTKYESSIRNTASSLANYAGKFELDFSEAQVVTNSMSKELEYMKTQSNTLFTRSGNIEAINNSIADMSKLFTVTKEVVDEIVEETENAAQNVTKITENIDPKPIQQVADTANKVTDEAKKAAKAVSNITSPAPTSTTTSNKPSSDSTSKPKQKSPAIDTTALTESIKTLSEALKGLASESEETSKDVADELTSNLAKALEGINTTLSDKLNEELEKLKGTTQDNPIEVEDIFSDSNAGQVGEEIGNKLVEGIKKALSEVADFTDESGLAQLGEELLKPFKSSIGDIKVELKDIVDDSDLMSTEEIAEAIKKSLNDVKEGFKGAVEEANETVKPLEKMDEVINDVKNETKDLFKNFAKSNFGAIFSEEEIKAATQSLNDANIELEQVAQNAEETKIQTRNLFSEEEIAESERKLANMSQTSSNTRTKLEQLEDTVDELTQSNHQLAQSTEQATQAQNKAAQTSLGETLGKIKDEAKSVLQALDKFVDIQDDMEKLTHPLKSLAKGAATKVLNSELKVTKEQIKSTAKDIVSFKEKVDELNKQDLKGFAKLKENFKLLGDAAKLNRDKLRLTFKANTVAKFIEKMNKPTEKATKELVDKVPGGKDNIGLFKGALGKIGLLVGGIGIGSLIKTSTEEAIKFESAIMQLNGRLGESVNILHEFASGRGLELGLNKTSSNKIFLIAGKPYWAISSYLFK